MSHRNPPGVEEPYGPAKIGEALKARGSEIRWDPILALLQELETYESSTLQPILDGSVAGWLSQEEKIEGYVSRRSQTANPAIWVGIVAKQLGVAAVVAQRNREKYARESPELAERWPDRADPSHMQPVRPAGYVDGPWPTVADFADPSRVPDPQRGSGLKDAVEMCKESIKHGDASPEGRVLRRMALKCLEQMLSELRRLSILGVCEYCGKTFYPASPKKRTCSYNYEGRDCHHNQASKASYRRNHPSP